MGEQLDNLRDSLRDVLDKNKVIAENIPSVERAAADADKDRMAAEKAIERADEMLTEAENYIEREGQAAVRQALNALQQFGQNNAQITAIARNATAAANK